MLSWFVSSIRTHAGESHRETWPPVVQKSSADYGRGIICPSVHDDGERHSLGDRALEQQQASVRRHVKVGLSRRPCGGIMATQNGHDLARSEYLEMLEALLQGAAAAWAA